jgi:broad specificity phosphatase PhoE
MATIYFLRHGQSVSNVNDTFSGLKDDTTLTLKGEAQAVLAGEGLKSSEIRIDRFVASPLNRAQKTARLVSDVIGFDAKNIETDPRFGEYDMGELTGKPRTSVTSAQLIAAKGAEDPRQFMQRVGDALKELENSEGNILVVSHAGVGRIIRCYKEGIDPTGFYDLPAYPNAMVVPL